MKAIGVCLAAAAVLLTVVVWRQATKIAALEVALGEASVARTKQIAADRLELQSKCAVQARKFFLEMGYDKDEYANYENHYNASMNRCFVEILKTDPTRANGVIWTFRDVFDAFERKQYGTYSWHTVEGKKFWEVAPFQCEATMPSGERKSCSSDDEFSELTRVYMKAGG